jgi:hypothetical protein
LFDALSLGEPVSPLRKNGLAGSRDGWHFRHRQMIFAIGPIWRHFAPDEARNS